MLWGHDLCEDGIHLRKRQQAPNVSHSQFASARDLAFSPDDTQLAAATAYEVQIWDVSHLGDK